MNEYLYTKGFTSRLDINCTYWNHTYVAIECNTVFVASFLSLYSIDSFWPPLSEECLSATCHMKIYPQYCFPLGIYTVVHLILYNHRQILIELTWQYAIYSVFVEQNSILYATIHSKLGILFIHNLRSVAAILNRKEGVVPQYHCPDYGDIENANSTS